MPGTPGFFESLPVLQRASDAFDVRRYRAAPEDWALAVTDIVDSSIAIANGRHKTVNFVAAMMTAPSPPNRKGMLCATLSAMPDTLDDGAAVDLTGLSCRWDALHSQHGKMLTLINHDAPEPGALHAAVLQLAQQDGDPSAVREATLRERWPPKGFMLEARARQGGGWLAIGTMRVLAETLPPLKDLAA